MNTIVDTIAPRLLGPSVMVAAAITVKGYSDIGDGFSAGVIVGLAVALRYITLGWELTERGLPVLRHAPAVAVAGLLISLAVGFAGTIAGEAPFTHSPGAGERVVHIGSLELITAVAFDVGVLMLVAGVLVTLVHHLARLAQDPPG